MEDKIDNQVDRAHFIYHYAEYELKISLSSQKSKQRHLKKIAELKQENRELKQQALEEKNTRVI